MSSILNTVNLLVAEIAHLRSAGPHFRIVHRFWVPGISGCVRGEEVFACLLVQRGREYQLRLSLAQRLIFDYLARHSRLAQSARQIELGIRADDFYKDHAKNASGRAAVTRRIPRSSIKVHLTRLERALGVALREAGMNIDPGTVLVRQTTAGNEKCFRLKATCLWSHDDLTAPDGRPLNHEE